MTARTQLGTIEVPSTFEDTRSPADKALDLLEEVDHLASMGSWCESFADLGGEEKDVSFGTVGKIASVEGRVVATPCAPYFPFCLLLTSGGSLLMSYMASGGGQRVLQERGTFQSSRLWASQNRATKSSLVWTCMIDFFNLQLLNLALLRLPSAYFSDFRLLPFHHFCPGAKTWKSCMIIFWSIWATFERVQLWRWNVDLIRTLRKIHSTIRRSSIRLVPIVFRRDHPDMGSSGSGSKKWSRPRPCVLPLSVKPLMFLQDTRSFASQSSPIWRNKLRQFTSESTWKVNQQSFLLQRWTYH